MPKDLHPLRHSCEHVLTMAMLRLYPGLKAAMGPATDEGFYFDFDYSQKISEEDFPKIEKEMDKIIQENLPITKDELSVKKAREFFNSNTYKGNEYKHEWLDEIESRGEKVSIYWMGEKAKDIPETFVDICSGPHVKSTGEIKAFKLLSVAGAYWHGDEKNKMLTRIYGTAFYSQKELDEYLHNLEEAKKRDHRKIGKDLDLYSIDEEIGKGLILWHPKLAIARHEVEKFWKEKHLQAGYQLVYTPHLASMKTFTKTRHYSHYIDYMFPVMLHQFIEGKSSSDYQQEEQLKPMNCPFHCAIFNSRSRSYKELPLRYAELGTVYRYERSGQLYGMTRVRGFTQDDSHIFCRKSQAVDEVINVIKLTKEFYDIFGFKDFKAYLSTMPEKHLGLPKDWQFAEKTLAQAIEKCGLPYKVDEGEGAFYGPKIDFKIKDSIGREWQLATVQWDFNLPSRGESSPEEIETFKKLKAFRYIFGNEIPGKEYSQEHQLKTDKKIEEFLKNTGRGLGVYFTNEKGKKEEVIMIHRVILGALERFFGVLIEHYGGNFPTWLTPVQVKILPISDKQNDYARKVLNELKDHNIRVELDDRDETLQAKIRDAQLEKVSYMLILGDQEQKSKTLAIRNRSGKQTKLDLNKFIATIKQEIYAKIL